MSKAVSFVKTYFEYRKYCERYRDVDYFDYPAKMDANFVTPTSFTSVTLYGNYKAVERLTGKRFNFATDYLEHGVCFLDYPESAELMGYINRRGIKNVYTCSEWRRQVLLQYLQKNNLKRNVVAVGPYIKGVDNFKSKSDFDKQKAECGRTLVVFPSHSFDTSKITYCESGLITEIERIRHDFDTVIICMYWKDLLERTTEVEMYKQHGYRIASAGHRSDPHFLNRLRDLIELADEVMTNNLGSHIGYAISLNRPVYYFDQKVEVVTTYDKSSIENITNECREAFRNYPSSITDLQIQFVQKYWGRWRD